MIVSFIVRSGLVVGAVYYTRKVGFWGNSKQSDKLYNDIKATICPYAVQLKHQLPFDVPALPQAGEIRYLMKHYYNQGVKETFHFVHMLPCYAGRLAIKAKATFNEFANPPQAAISADSIASSPAPAVNRKQ